MKLNEYEVRVAEYTVTGIVEHKTRIIASTEMDAVIMAQSVYENGTPLEVKKIKAL